MKQQHQQLTTLPQFLFLLIIASAMIGILYGFFNIAVMLFDEAGKKDAQAKEVLIGTYIDDSHNVYYEFNDSMAVIGDSIEGTDFMYEVHNGYLYLRQVGFYAEAKESYPYTLKDDTLTIRQAGMPYRFVKVH